MMIGMSQEKLGEARRITFQQIEKYEKGTNRMGASRLHHIARVLDVPIEFFYEGASSDQGSNGPIMIDGQSRSMTDFLATSEGLGLVRAFTAIKDSKIWRRIVDVAKAVALADRINGWSALLPGRRGASRGEHTRHRFPRMPRHP